MIISVEMISGISLLCELVNDEVDQLIVKLPVKLISERFGQKDGSYYFAYAPMLYHPFGLSQYMHIKKSSIVFYDIASDYYTDYYNIVSQGLLKNELDKQEMVRKFYNGEDEANLQYSREQENFTSEPEDDIIVVEGNNTIH